MLTAPVNIGDADPTMFPVPFKLEAKAVAIPEPKPVMPEDMGSVGAIIEPALREEDALYVTPLLVVPFQTVPRVILVSEPTLATGYQCKSVPIWINQLEVIPLVVQEVPTPVKALVLLVIDTVPVVYVIN